MLFITGGRLAGDLWMIVCLGNVLSGAELRRLQTRLKTARFASGQRTAGWHARAVKRNRQTSGKDTPAVAEAAGAVLQALARNDVFQSAARPLRLSPVLFSRYEPGMEYGPHVDDALMRTPDGGRLRSDVSVTVFLSDPAAYEGGALVIEDSGGERPFKLGAGDAVVYSATSLHRVEPVRKGARLAAVLWAQSVVADASEREMLFDLDVARRALFEAHGKTREFDLIAKTHANLLRRWSRL
jgi:PKHD-type hydroxylase